MNINFAFIATFLVFSIVSNAQNWIQASRVEGAIISTDSSKNAITKAIILMLKEDGVTVDPIDSINGVIETAVQLYVPEHRSGMIDYPITLLCFNKKYEINDNNIKITCNNYSDYIAYCVNHDRLCNCFSQADSIELEQKAKSMGRFALSFSNEYSVWLALYKNKDIGFKLTSEGRNFSKEYESIEANIASNRILFLKHSDYVVKAKSDFGNKFAKEHTSVLQEKTRSQFIWIDKNIWNSFVSSTIQDEFVNTSKAVGGRVDQVIVDNTTVLISINNRLVPTDKKERKKWYKANSISEEEEIKIETSFN